jgi:hypothetical protein
MPFGLGPFGWFLFPYLTQYWDFGYPYSYAPYPRFPWWPAYSVSPYMYGYGVPPFISKADEQRILEDQAKTLESQLVEIRKRLSELKEQA